MLYRAVFVQLSSWVIHFIHAASVIMFVTIVCYVWMVHSCPGTTWTDNSGIRWQSVLLQQQTILRWHRRRDGHGGRCCSWQYDVGTSAVVVNDPTLGCCWCYKPDEVCALCKFFIVIDECGLYRFHIITELSLFSSVSSCACFLNTC